MTPTSAKDTPIMRASDAERGEGGERHQVPGASRRRPTAEEEEGRQREREEQGLALHVPEELEHIGVQ